MNDSAGPALQDAEGGEREQLKKMLGASVIEQLNLPAALEAEFLAHHHRTAVQHIRTNWPLIIPVLFMAAAATMLLGLVPAALYAVAAMLFFSLCFVCAVVVIAVHSDLWQAYLPRFMEALVVIVLLLILSSTTFVPHGDSLHVVLVTFVALIMVAVFALSNLGFRRVIPSVFLASALFFLVAMLAGVSIEWRPLIISLIGGGGMGLVIGISQEIYGRKVFLQERALFLEHQAVDALAKKLDQLSRTDALTGLMNRRHFEEVLAREWSSCRRDDSPIAVLFIDVDHFKGYNDHYGHPAGDVCLASVGRALASRLSRASDVVARYGGEEFVVVLPRTDREEVARIAERILLAVDGLAIRHEASSCADTVTVSIGAAVMVPGPDIEAGELLSRSDAALYAAKHAGRHRVVFAA